MILYVALFTTLLSCLVLTLVYLADFWEREPLSLLQNAFLAGLSTQLILVLAAHRIFEIPSWTGWLHVVSSIVLAVVLPILLHNEKELDERFDGIVYAVTFATGSTSVIHLFNLPQALARSPEHAILASAQAPTARDLALLLSAPGLLAELGNLAVLLAASTIVGAVLGISVLAKKPLQHQIGATLLAAAALGMLEMISGGWWPARDLVVIGALTVGFVLKRRSVFRLRQQEQEREIFLEAFKTGLMIFGAIVLALTLVIGLTDRWQLLETTQGVRHSTPERQPS